MTNDAVAIALANLAEQIRLVRSPRPSQLLTLEQAGETLGRSAKTVRRYIEYGWLKAVRLPAGVGTREGWMIQSSDLQAFIDSRKSRRSDQSPSTRRERDGIRRNGKIAVPRLIG